MQFTIACLLATGVNAATVLVGGKNCTGWNTGVHNSCDTTLWSINTKTGSSSVVADLGGYAFTIQEHYQVGANSVVCGSSYYFTWQKPHGTHSVREGIRVLDLTTGASHDLATSSAYVALACDPEHADKFLGITGDLNDLRRYDPATQTETVIGSFPLRDGYYERMFSFAQDGSEAWMTWKQGYGKLEETDAWVDIMDTSSGEMKTSTAIAFSGEKGVPALLSLDAKRGLFSKEGGDYGLWWADLDVTDGHVTANIGSTPEPHVDCGTSVRQVPQMCGSHLLSFSSGHAPSVSEVSPADGALINAVNLTMALNLTDPFDHITALACLHPSTEDFAFV